MQQYEQAKAACGDAILLFRMGDFYELFHDDAERAAPPLGLTLTSRDKGDDPIPMAGFPHHQLDGYLARLIKSGFRVAVCEQVEDPSEARGLVRREVTRVVSPGTITDPELLDPRQSNYLMAVIRGTPPHGKKTRSSPAGDLSGVAWIDISTAVFHACTLPTERLEDLLARLVPSEILVPESADPEWPTGSAEGSAELLVTRQPDWASSFRHARDTVLRHFRVSTVEGFGFDEQSDLAIQAAGLVLHYLQESQPAALDYVDQLTPWQESASMGIDQATWRSLEITRTLRHNQREGSLFDIIDRTQTSMGSRQLADWLARPLICQASIEARLDAVGELVGDPGRRGPLRDSLKGLHDIQRLLSRLAAGRATPRDLAGIGKTLGKLPELRRQLARCQADSLQRLHDQLDLCAELSQRIESTLEESCPLSSREGGLVVAGCDARLDELRELARGGKQWIADYQARIASETGIPTLKVGFNKVFGYYVEVTHQHRDKLPEGFIRKQTLKNAERFITPELKEYEDKVLSADQQAIEQEVRIFSALRDEALRFLPSLKNNALLIAQADAFAALAELAAGSDYVRPQITPDPVIRIEDGRHPVLDVTRPLGAFVPNSTVMDEEQGAIHLITGPNMAGKSTYIRQTALLVLLSHIGSFVPARSATIGITDRLFARVGASDELSRGQSTFMVEMSETARILNTASSRSLVILDEIGRGTSTYDGVSLAWAIVEYLHDRIGCRTLFATHYHELTRLPETLPRVANYNVLVREWKDEIVFLHQIAPGPADRSYGIHVARLAGVPRPVNRRAQAILEQLEGIRSESAAVGQATRPGGEIQLTLFESPTHPLIEKLKRLDTDHVTPMNALAMIQQWQEELESESPPVQSAEPASQSTSTADTAD